MKRKPFEEIEKAINWLRSIQPGHPRYYAVVKIISQLEEMLIPGWTEKEK